MGSVLDSLTKLTQAIEDKRVSPILKGYWNRQERPQGLFVGGYSGFGVLAIDRDSLSQDKVSVIVVDEAQLRMTTVNLSNKTELGLISSDPYDFMCDFFLLA